MKIDETYFLIETINKKESAYLGDTLISLRESKKEIIRKVYATNDSIFIIERPEQKIQFEQISHSTFIEMHGRFKNQIKYQ